MNCRIESDAFRQLHLVVTAFSGLLQNVAQQALADLQRTFRIVGLIDPAHQNFRMLRFAGNCEGTLGDDLCIHGSPDALAVGIDKRRHGYVVILVGRRCGIAAPA